jgi:hypothetical protein
MSGRSIEVRAAIRGRSFVNLSEGDRADQYAITLDQHEIGCEHQFRLAERLSYAAATRFPEQPCQDGA